ncbi:MAG TPA: hypothetical protein VF787_07950 [Thermoanaerobaculia bacterium]
MFPSKRCLVIAFLAALIPLRGAAQIGKLLSPGPLAKAHAALEGAANCAKCHEQGKRVSPARCLACHKPIARRIAQKKGVHRNAGNDCVACHVEHAGRDAELRPFDPRKFDHRAETGFALNGRHAVIACSQCHRTRSYLGLTANCTSCHKDPHNGRLGSDCLRCHPVTRPFLTAARQFDHDKTTFPLEGAHRNAPCVKCHADGQYAGIRHGTCADCHRNPHQSKVGSDCRSCHTPTAWTVARFDHARTGTALVGRHRNVPCARCHVRPPASVRLKLRPCASCHKDPHRGAFKQDCAACHDENGFKGAPFDHAAQTQFALDGKHRRLACVACHPRAGDFRGLSAQCSSCHKDPHKSQLGTACEKCHTTDSFRIARHEHRRFPEFFGGQHAALRCEQCHRGPLAERVYQNLSTECGSCHRDVHQGQFPRCTNCHSVDAAEFAPVLFDHDKTNFALTGKHKSASCRQCHASGYRETLATCASCHKDVHQGRLGTSCKDCHGTATFRVERYTHRKPGSFFRGRHAAATCTDCHKPAVDIAARFTGLGRCVACHSDPHRGQLGTTCETCHNVDAKWSAGASRAFHKAGLFPLEGRHLVTPCEDCHRDGVVKGTPSRCYDCHWVRRQDDIYRTRLGSECENCHRPTAWSAVNWDHFARTTFALSGVHRTLSCDQCHAGEFGTMRSDCASCHAGDYARAHDPDHRAAGFPLICQLCHRPADVSWQQARFAHTTFVLAGVHQTQVCGACHRNDIYAGTTRDCAGCHRADYDRASDPAHAAAGFALTCDQCHRFTDGQWSDATYAHLVWPLVGRHAAPRCSTCHTNGAYAGRGKECVSCHRSEYDRSVNPAHLAAGFPLTCELCHTLVDPAWNHGRFSHDTFALAGAHLLPPCTACHVNGVYQSTPRTCAGCHQRDYDDARDPNHTSAGFSTACDTCHKYTDTSWDQGVFNHLTFPLAGRHTTQACGACHLGGVYQGTPRTCAGCHQDDYNGTRDPNHTNAGFPTTCDTCHKYTDTSWDQGVFSHLTFPLAGKHTTQACGACHIGGVYQGTPRTCAGCHQDDYNGTRDPNHISAGFLTTCDTCHKFTDTSWNQGVFNHLTFPLAGRHATQACGACHIGGVYQGTPRSCAGCHQDDYNGTRDPNHINAGFPTTCETCHKYTDTSWDQGVFSHLTFPLAGRHATQACGACHIGGVYRGTPRTCAGCHQDGYNGTRDPNHISAGFPTTCETCHKFTDTSWNQGVFNHLTFPLAGRHATQACDACHLGGVYRGTPRTCAGCHQNDYNGTRDPNHISAGFPTTCETCHKFTDTSWDQGVFNHLTFPLAGIHSSRPCGECHIGGVYPGTPRTCAGCHLTAYDAARDPNHIAAGFPTTCDLCHRFADTSWTQGVFNHTRFPITTGRHAGHACSACHTNPSVFQVFSCTTNCHDRGETDGHHREVAGYQYVSLACYACHPQGRAD